MSPETSDPDRPAPPADGPGHPAPGADARPDPEGGHPAPAPGADARPEPEVPARPEPGVDARPERRSARSVGLVLGTAVALTVAGVPLGLLWAALAPDTPVVKTPAGAVYAEPQPEQPIAADGWFSLLGLGFGVLAALALWVLLRRRRGPVGLLAGVLGGLGAAPVAWQVGRRVGLSTYQRLLADAPDGQAFSKPADLRAGGVHQILDVLPVPYGNLLLPAFAVAVTYTLLAGWSRWPSLRPEPHPDWAPAGPPAAGGPGAGPVGEPAAGAASAGPVGEPPGGPGISSGPAGSPAPTAAPEPPAPGAAEPPRG